MKCNVLSLLFMCIVILTNCAPSTPTPPTIRPPQPDAPTMPPPEVGAEPTSIVVEQVALREFVHPTSRFSINHPDNWRIVAQTDGVLLIEPSGNGGYSIFFADVQQTYSLGELRNYMLSFLLENLVDTPDNFVLLGENQTTAGQLTLQFESVDPQLGDTINELRAVQHDTIVYLLLISTTPTQWEISQSKLYRLLDSFRPLDTNPAPTPTPVPPEWEVTGSLNAELAFLYPSDWQILTQTDNAVIVGMPDTDISFSGSNLPWSSTDSAAATNAIALYLQALQDTYPTVEAQPLSEQTIQNLTGVGTQFVYTTEDGTVMQGAITAVYRQGKVYQMVFTAPADVYEVSLNWFVPMYNSFRILPAHDVIFPR